MLLFCNFAQLTQAQEESTFLKIYKFKSSIKDD